MSDSQAPEPTVIEALDHRITQSRRAVTRRHLQLLNSVQQAARETQVATTDYLGFWAGESARWADFAARQGRAVSRPKVRRAMWRGVRRALGLLQHEVDRRIAELDQPCLSAVPDGNDMRAPLANYDEMNARLIVAAVKTLDAEACREVERYEAAHKNRATVLRAVRRRIAA